MVCNQSESAGGGTLGKLAKPEALFIRLIFALTSRLNLQETSRLIVTSKRVFFLTSSLIYKYPFRFLQLALLTLPCRFSDFSLVADKFSNGLLLEKYVQLNSTKICRRSEGQNDKDRSFPCALVHVSKYINDRQT